MSSFAEFSTKVIRVVAFGAGAVAIGWLGWKTYVLYTEAEIVPPEDSAAVGEIVEEIPADENVIKVCETADGFSVDEPVCAPPLMAVQESCAVDSIFAPVEPVHDEDATIQLDVVCVSNEEAELPSPTDVPACEEHTPVAAVEAVPVPTVRKKKANKALAAMEQQVPDNVVSISEPVASAPVEDARADPESVPVESADVPASEEPTPVSSREELPAAPIQDRSADLANMVLEELFAVPAKDVSYGPNKTRWNASFQRRYLARLKLSRV
ncbi:hypothetical protein GHT06_020485 [Daphnia sinensis]|uniref:Uncharacterized protein n=1 Tax=Daphnia sinensis TaxID=1820382 RepID=A0AAD5PMX6_9CRUS|nr:hypothetical protein GHT06_020485 [Daphnia sinensis]